MESFYAIVKRGATEKLGDNPIRQKASSAVAGALSYVGTGVGRDAPSVYAGREKEKN